MAQRLSECSQSNLIYDLSAILIHKGSAANSGHYTAHIKDVNTGVWWEFDDESVSKMGRKPFGSTSSSQSAKAVRSESTEISSFPEVDMHVNHNHTNENRSQASETNGARHVRMFSSSDAYMLMYVLRHSSNDGGKAGIPCCDQSKNQFEVMEVDGPAVMEVDGPVVSNGNDELIPAHVLKEVNMMNSKYLDSCEQYKSKKQFEVNRITERRQEVRSILSVAPVKSPEDSYFWISTDFLRQWSDSITASYVKLSLLLDLVNLTCWHLFLFHTINSTCRIFSFRVCICILMLK